MKGKQKKGKEKGTNKMRKKGKLEMRLLKQGGEGD